MEVDLASCSLRLEIGSNASETKTSGVSVVVANDRYGSQTHGSDRAVMVGYLWCMIGVAIVIIYAGRYDRERRWVLCGKTSILKRSEETVACLTYLCQRS